MLKQTIIIAAIAGLVFALAPAAQAVPVPILHYTFDGTGSTEASIGSDTTPVIMRTFALDNQDLHGAAGSGVSGLAADKAFDNTASAAGANGGAAYHAADNDNIDGLMSFTVVLWYRTQYAPAMYGWGFDNDGDFHAELCVPVEDARPGVDGFVGNGADGEFPAVNGNDKWIFYAQTYDGTLTASNLKTYRGFRSDADAITINGGWVGAVTSIDTHSANQGQTDDGTDALAIGNKDVLDWGSRALKGHIDNFRIYGSKTDASGALSLADLEAIRAADVVPEPATMALLGIGGLGLLLRRRGRKA